MSARGTSLVASEIGTLLLTLAAACDSEPEPIEFSVADSSGIEVVTNHVTPSATPLRILDDVPERQLAGDELYEITAVRPLGQGGVALAASGTGSVLVYDESGLLTATLGRAGDGPGEFRWMESLVPLPPDSLAIYDSEHRRLTVFSLAGDFGRVLTLTGLAPEGGPSRIHPLDEALVFVGESGFTRPQEMGLYQTSAHADRIDLAGSVLSTYGDFPGMQAFSANGLVGHVPFGAALSTTTMEDQLIVGTGEKPELQIFGPDGRLTRIVRWTADDRTVTQDRMDEINPGRLEKAAISLQRAHIGRARPRRPYA